MKNLLRLIFLLTIIFAGCNKNSTVTPLLHVTYNGNGNTGGNVPTDAKAYTEGASVTVLDNSGSLVKSGFVFSGWNSTADGSGTTYAVNSNFTMGSTNVTLYAVWNKDYSVTYNGNGNTAGTVPVDSKLYISGASVTVLDNTGALVKSGYLFSGWNTAADGSGTNYAVNANFSMGSTNVTLYAVWTVHIIVTYDGNGSTGGSVPVDSKVYTNGATVAVLNNSGNLVKPGFYFTGWNTSADGTGTSYASGSSFSIGSSAITLYASWTASGSVWTSTTMPNTNKWVSVAYGNNSFVATGIGTDTSAVSTDGGKTWSIGILPTSTTWSCVGYGVSTFVSFSSLGYAATSPDGITWTKRSLPTSYSYSSVVYANNQFVAVAANSNSSLTSPDGITWTAQTLPSTSYWTSVAYGNSTYVAVASLGTGTVAATSPDGITWTAQTLPVSSGWRNVSFGNGVFVAVTGSSSNVAVSADGINWTAHTLPSSGEWSLTYGNGIFLAAKYNSNVVVTSTDGINWQQYTTIPTSVWSSVSYGGSNFVAVSFKNNTVASAE